MHALDPHEHGGAVSHAGADQRRPLDQLRDSDSRELLRRPDEFLVDAGPLFLPRVWRQQRHRSDAGAGRRASGLVFFTQPAFDPGPDGVFFAGQGQLKIEVQSPINS